MTPRGRIRRRGMTLLEVLAAAALLGLFFIGVYGLVFATIDKRQMIEDKALPWAVGPAVIRQIEDDLRAFVQAPFDPVKDVFIASAPRESETRLDLVVAAASREKVKVKDELVRAGANETGYRLRRSEEDRSLYSLYRREDFGVDSEPNEGGRYFKLCDRVKAFTIAWFPEDPGEPGSDAAEGLPDWDQRKEQKMPWGCRVTLVLAGIQTAEEAADDRPAQDHVFVTYIPFRTRFDKSDGGAPPPGQNPGSNR